MINTALSLDEIVLSAPSVSLDRRENESRDSARSNEFHQFIDNDNQKKRPNLAWKSAKMHRTDFCCRVEPHFESKRWSNYQHDPLASILMSFSPVDQWMRPQSPHESPIEDRIWSLCVAMKVGISRRTLNSIDFLFLLGPIKRSTNTIPSIKTISAGGQKRFDPSPTAHTRTKNPQNERIIN